MTAVRLILVASVAVPLVATATASAANPLPPAPDVQSRHAKMAKKNLDRWWRFFKNDGCLIAERRVVPKINRLGKSIVRLSDRRDRALLGRYFDRTFIPYVNARLKGAPGYGTFKEIDQRRIASTKRLTEQLPKAPSEAPRLSAEQIAAFVTQVNAYRKAALADHAYVTGLMRASACHRRNWVTSRGVPPHVLGFRRWERSTRPAEIDERLGKIVKAAIPRIDALHRAKVFVAEHDNKGPTTRAEYGELLRAAVGLYVDLQKDAWARASLEHWAKALPAAQAEPIRATIKAYDSRRDRIAAIYAKRIAEVTTPEKVRDRRAARVARRLVRKHFGKTRGWRITGKMERKTRRKTAAIKRRRKVYIKKYTETFDAFGVHAITRDKPYTYFIDMPGVPLKLVCSLRYGRARFYRRGLGVKLRRWTVETHLVSPILCRNSKR